MSKESSAMGAVLRCKCPNCRKSGIFEQASVFPFGGMLRMHKDCPECGARLAGETNNGPGINFVLTTLLLFANIIWYYPLFGLSYADNSIYYFLLSSVAVVTLLQPWLMRLSRSIYLHLLWMMKE